jgi:hypothetical protein
MPKRPTPLRQLERQEYRDKPSHLRTMTEALRFVTELFKIGILLGAPSGCPKAPPVLPATIATPD